MKSFKSVVEIQYQLVKPPVSETLFPNDAWALFSSFLNWALGMYGFQSLKCARYAARFRNHCYYLPLGSQHA